MEGVDTSLLGAFPAIDAATAELRRLGIVRPVSTD
jgi:hypothetical protein